MGKFIAFIAGVFLAASAFVGAANSAAYDTVYATASAVNCSDTTCPLTNSIRVVSVTFQGIGGTALYTWQVTCGGSPDGVSYIRPVLATTGCFHMNGFAAGGTYPFVQYVSTISAMQALGTLSSIYPNVFVSASSQGGNFTWITGSLPCNASTGGGDGGTTFCAGTPGNYLTTGYWQRVYDLSTLGGLPLDWFNGVDNTGVSDSSTGIGLAEAAALALSSANSQVNLLGGAGKTYKANSGLGTIDSMRVGFDGQGAYFNLSGIGTSSTGLTIDSSSANPYRQKVTLKDMSILGPSGGSTGTTGIGVLFKGTTGSAAHIKVSNVGILGWHVGAQIDTNAYLINFDHVSVFQDDIGISIPSGTSNSGENISVTNGSGIFNNNSYAISSLNPNADWHVIGSSIDYNQVAGTSTSAQIQNVESAFSISDSHVEDFTHPVDTCTASTSQPSGALNGNVYVRSSGASSHLIDAGSGCYISVSGGVILAAVSPQTTIGAASGGFINVQGVTIGSAAFDNANGSYVYCATAATACSTNRATSSSAVISTTWNLTAVYTVATLPAASTGTAISAFVSDASSCTLNGSLTGGGSTLCRVHSNGSSWVGG